MKLIQPTMKSVFFTFLGLILFVTISNSQWKLNYYVDDFGDSTKESYNYVDIIGKFSNSATTNSECLFRLIQDKDKFRIIVFEYQKYPANFTTSYSSGGYTISASVQLKVKDPDGEIKTFFFDVSKKEIYQKNTPRIPQKSLAYFLTKKGVYKFTFKEGAYSISTYNFELEIVQPLEVKREKYRGEETVKDKKKNRYKRKTKKHNS